MPDFPNILLPAIPGFVILLIVEIIYVTKMQREVYEVKDAAASLSLGLGNLIIGLFVGVLVLLFFSVLYQFRFFTIPYNAWWAWILCFFADDFSYYWMHKISHEVRWFWASHAVHHSSEKYNLATALRQTWTGNLTGSFICWFWMPLVGFHPAMILLMQSVSLLYQFWIHTETINKMPRWYEFIFNTPSHHRVHHGSDELYLDRNHGGTLIIWDRLFGTFQEEKFRPTYGLTKNVKSFNPVKVAFHEWRNLGKDVCKAKNIKQAFHYLFGAPGWSADGTSYTTKQIRQKTITSPKKKNE